MANVMYISNVSLDGYIEDAEGSFAWTASNHDVFEFITELVRPIGTYLLGRRLYETMSVWETDAALAAQSELTAVFADAWQAADNVVYSTTLGAVATSRTRLDRTFDPSALCAMKASATRDLTIGGADLATQALRAGQVDELHLLVRPVVLGAGKPALSGGAHAEPELVQEQRLGGGVVYLRYCVLS